MKRPSYFIIVPADDPVGPVKGAYALANELVRTRDVTLVTIKTGPGAESHLDKKVNKVCLSDNSNSFIQQIKFYKSLLKQKGKRKQIYSISFCIQADFLNSFCKSYAIISTSVRGNLLMNYADDMGWYGKPVAILHILRLRRFDHVFSMSIAMSRQLKSIGGLNTTIVGNFIDESFEPALEINKVNKPTRLVFVGSLSTRKRPLLLLKHFNDLLKVGYNFELDILGEGPLKHDLKQKIKDLDIANSVKVHGFVKNPLKIVERSDIMVLPSTSEGASRAVLESLFVGIPCVLAKVDGNTELITEGKNGALFAKDQDLANAILRAKQIIEDRPIGERHNLLPKTNRQKDCTKLILKTLEN